MLNVFKKQKKNKKGLFKILLIVIGAIAAIMAIIAIIKKPKSVYKNEPDEKNPMEGKRVRFVENEEETVDAEGVCGHLEAVGIANHKGTFYENVLKRMIDIILSFFGLLLLSPVFLFLSIWIFIDDPGPVIFTQKRFGKNKQFFKLHKFRSMKMSAPHDLPTHMLENPDQYYTKAGEFIRSHSLDELPQLWDIFIGNMSFIGPRPGLWNQEYLIAERDKYGANDIKPGLSGWAQINGRDTIKNPVKAKLDGEYTKKLSLKMDVKCLLGSVGAFAKDFGSKDGEIEESLRPYVPETDPTPVYGWEKEIRVPYGIEKRVLITGAGSYIGENFKNYAAVHYPNLYIDTVDMRNDTWRTTDFSSYDAVYHVAGIAHADVGNVDEETKEMYYRVNTDLAIETAKKAKASGVKQFIFMSSMIVYGESAPYGKPKRITKDTKPAPANFYGDSKWQADKGVRALETKEFKVAVLRPPMIYGKGSKGNYPSLASMAKKLPVFPDVPNERSMLYIENLCAFLCNLILSGENGIYFPQNQEYSRTSAMVRMIGETSRHKICVRKGWSWIVRLSGLIPGKIRELTNKAFGNLTYDQEISKYGFEYQIVGLKESIKRTESIMRPKICLVSASGGHFEQLCRLKPLLDQYPGFIVTENTGIECKADYYVTQTGIGEKGLVRNTIRLFKEARKICRIEKPDFVITTGTYISLPFMVYCKLHKKKFIYIETFARITDTTKAGKFMYRFADLFIYQWKELEPFYPKGVYGGSIY